MAWIYLITAGLFEIGWPVGLKWAQEPRKLVVGVVMAVVCMRFAALPRTEGNRDRHRLRGLDRDRVWVFGDPGSLGRYFGVALIIAGVVTLRLAH